MKFAALAAMLVILQDQPSLKDAAEKTRGQKSYTATFKAQIRVPGSDPLVIEGRLVWVTPGVLFLRYKASGGEEVLALRVGGQVRMYFEQSEEWVPAEEAGKPGIGRGLQNPDEVLAAILKLGDRAKAADAEEVRGIRCSRHDLDLRGEDIFGVTKELAPKDAFDWEKSSGKVRLLAGSDGLIRRMAFEASLKPTSEKLKDQIATYQGTVDVQAYNQDFSMSFTLADPRNKKETVIPISPEAAQEIEKLKGVPDELKGQLKKLQEP